MAKRSQINFFNLKFKGEAEHSPIEIAALSAANSISKIVDAVTNNGSNICVILKSLKSVVQTKETKSSSHMQLVPLYH